MNVYLMNEDGDTFYIAAETMIKAIRICEQRYLKEIYEECKLVSREYNGVAEKEYYYEQILQSCSLMGELKNWPADQK